MKRGARHCRRQDSSGIFRPDGLRVAYGEFGKDRITILTLRDGSSREVTLDGQENLNSLAWSHDGQDLFVTTWRREGSDLLRVTLHNGNVSYLREETGRWFANPRPSPDGRRFAPAGRSALAPFVAQGVDCGPRGTRLDLFLHRGRVSR
jgi:dipeptidyl aminopeptidase/acylaminoacyl peptidase